VIPLQIKKKADCLYFLTYFSYIAKADLDKLYFTFDWERNGTITIMKYLDGSYSTHRKNDVMWDLHEIILNENEIVEFIWTNRRFINPILRGIEYASSLK
jgi:hypothetical protein